MPKTLPSVDFRRMMSSMTEEQIRYAILKALYDVAPAAEVEIDSVKPRSNFAEHVGLDSIDQVNLALALQRMLDVHIPESDYSRLTSLASCVNYLLPRCARKTLH